VLALQRIAYVQRALAMVSAALSPAAKRGEEKFGLLMRLLQALRQVGCKTSSLTSSLLCMRRVPLFSSVQHLYASLRWLKTTTEQPAWARQLCQPGWAARLLRRADMPQTSRPDAHAA